MTKVTTIPDALADAAAWYLVARCFERPRPGWADDVAALAREIADPALAAAADAVRETREGTYLAVFGPGGRVSPREAGHAGLRDPGRLLADLAHAYEAFGYAPRTEDPLDHVAVEAGFVAYLRLKEAAAATAGDDDALAVTVAAREAFAREHLAPLAAGLARGLVGEDGHAYAALADSLLARLPVADVPVSPGIGDPLADGCGACVGRHAGFDDRG